jgi:hypothetical protein
MASRKCSASQTGNLISSTGSARLCAAGTAVAMPPDACAIIVISNFMNFGGYFQ